MQYREIYNEDYCVFIDTTNIILVENGDKHSLTFQIINEEEGNTNIENLVLNSKNNGGYSAFITEYDLTQQDLIKLANGENLTTKTPSSITEIENLARLNIDGDGSDCVNIITHTVSMCRNISGNTIFNNGESGNDCVGLPFDVEYRVMIIEAGCLSGGGGSSDGGYNSGGGNSGIGNSGGNGNPILTSPVLLKDRHKKALDKLTTNNSDGTKTKVKEKIDELKARLTTDFKEMGYHFIKNGNDFIIREPIWRGANQVAYSNGDQIAQNTKVVLHMHQNLAEIIKGVNLQTGLPNVTYNELVAIWSGGDIDKTAEQFGELGNDTDFTSILVTQEGTFALRVGNSSDLNLTNLTLGNDESAKDAFEKDFNIKVLTPCNGASNSCYVEKFIEFLNTHLINGHPIGLILYQAVYDAQGNIINWIKK